MTEYPNQIQSRYGPRPPSWSEWITRQRDAGPPPEGDAELAEDHLTQDLFPQLGSTDEQLHTRWFSAGAPNGIAQVLTSRGVSNEFSPNVDPDETQEEHNARHEAEVLAKIELFPVDTE